MFQAEETIRGKKKTERAKIRTCVAKSELSEGAKALHSLMHEDI